MPRRRGRAKQGGGRQAKQVADKARKLQEKGGIVTCEGLSLAAKPPNQKLPGFLGDGLRKRRSFSSEHKRERTKLGQQVHLLLDDTAANERPVGHISLCRREADVARAQQDHALASDALRQEQAHGLPCKKQRKLPIQA